MEVWEAIQTKRAVRDFKPDPIPDEAVNRILNAGRRAQSSKNTQPWHFIAIQDRSTLKSLSELGDYSFHLANAGLGIAIITPSPEQRFSIMFDAGQAASYMQLAAWEMGIASCLASIYKYDEARDLLGFPDELHLRICISFGYPENRAELSRSLKKAGRRTLSEVVHYDKW
ncbi:MAG: nitroreductase family protein [Anaerolineales bacterium]|jgi:nitroreductase